LSKTTKRIALAFLLLCLVLGGAVLHRRNRGSSEGMKEATAGQSSASIVPPSAPAIAPSPAAEAKDSLPPGAEPGAATTGKTATNDERRRRKHEPRDEERPLQKSALAAAESAPTPGESEAKPEEAAVRHAKPGNMAIELRPKLGGSVSAFQIMKISAFVDGLKIAEVEDKTLWEGKPEMELWKGAFGAGEHALTVLVAYKGNGHGVFSYYDNYRYEARASTRFRLEEGARLQMMVDILDKGGINTSFDKRLFIAIAQR
jgi:hypothetical protein